MTTAIIITFCILLLLAYVFDLTAAKTKIPSVLLLLVMGWALRQGTYILNLSLPDFSGVLPVFGTLGLILIVLEGALELELNRSKIGLLKRSFVGAALPLLAMSFLLGGAFWYFGGFGFKVSLTNAIPLAVISSAIAIPTARALKQSDREFVVYESSLSDILGVLFFNFIALNEVIGTVAFGALFLELIAIVVVSFVASVALAFLLSKIDHHIKFIPIILLVILVYTVAKEFHLPALILILVFGLFLGNLDELKHIKWIKKLKPDVLDAEAQRFKKLTGEATFLVRSLFFILFGYLIDTAELINTDNIIWSGLTIFLIYFVRYYQLKWSNLRLRNLLFIAPRGLITILLYLSILPADRIPLVNKPVIIQVIVITSLLMMPGVITRGEKLRKVNFASKDRRPSWGRKARSEATESE